MFLDDFFKDAPHKEVEQLSCDSRLPMRNAIYFCISGVKYDGHDYVSEAIQNGAIAIVHSDDIDMDYNAIFIKVHDCLNTLNIVANKFYNHPANDMDNYIVGGCMCKSVISSILFECLNKLKKTGYIGERGIIYDDVNKITSYRTLTVIENLINLKQMKDKSIKSCVFESSLLNLSYHKLDSVNPCVFIYSGTEESSIEYKQIKYDYFDRLRNYILSLSDDTLLVVNADDDTFDNSIYLSHPKHLTYGIYNDADIKASSINYLNNGSIFVVFYKDKSYQVKTKLVGETNIYSVLSVIASFVDKLPIEEIISYMADIDQIEGKCEYINCGQKYNVIIDKAITFNNLNRLSSLICAITPTNNRKICILSADYTLSDDYYKKELSIIEKFANLIIVTISNSFGRDINIVTRALSKCINNTKFLIIDDRECAIESAIELLNVNDTLVITGLGNEKSLNLFLGKVKYDGDSVIAKKYIEKRLKEENESIEIY